MQASQNGVIGITLVSNWFEPLSEEKENKNAALRALDFMFGWQVYFEFAYEYNICYLLASNT